MIRYIRIQDGGHFSRWPSKSQPKPFINLYVNGIGNLIDLSVNLYVLGDAATDFSKLNCLIYEEYGYYYVINQDFI